MVQRQLVAGRLIAVGASPAPGVLNALPEAPPRRRSGQVDQVEQVVLPAFCDHKRKPELAPRYALGRAAKRVLNWTRLRCRPGLTSVTDRGYSPARYISH
jgi:hypothetical protein